jgi:hypothetical protein
MRHVVKVSARSNHEYKQKEAMCIRAGRYRIVTYLNFDVCLVLIEE